MTVKAAQLPSFERYGNYSSENYGAHTLVFTDAAGRDYYFSYKTLVAVYIPGHGKIVSENVWSVTTGKHLNWIDGGDKASRVKFEDFERVVSELLGEN